MVKAATTLKENLANSEWVRHWHDQAGFQALREIERLEALVYSESKRLHVFIDDEGLMISDRFHLHGQYNKAVHFNDKTRKFDVLEWYDDVEPNTSSAHDNPIDAIDAMKLLT